VEQRGAAPAGPVAAAEREPKPEDIARREGSRSPVPKPKHKAWVPSTSTATRVDVASMRILRNTVRNKAGLYGM
jgi:hypothetical protein